MIKKILVYLSICTSFIFCFLFGGKYINILALGNFDNSIGTIPIQMDIENYNYNSPNLFNIRNLPSSFSENSSAVVDYENGTITINDKYFNNSTKQLKDLAPSLEVGKEYIISATANTGNKFIFLQGTNNIWLFGTSRVLTEMDLESFIIFYGDAGNIVTIGNIQINLGSILLPYEPYYEFGYKANLSFVISSSGTGTIVNYYFNDNTYTKSTSSSLGDYLFKDLYIPFIIDSKGYVSLPNINFGISSISSTSSDILYSLQLELTPVINVYYKGEYTTNIYTKLNYMSNDLFFSGITFSDCKNANCRNNINAGDLSLTNPKILAITEQNSTGNISITNISTYYNDDIKNRNYFEYYNYLNVGFRIGNLGENYNFMSGRNYTFGISSLSSRIVDNQTTTTPLPDNELTNNKYNTCSAWYDIPCQLGNAITYVIYEAPIISPIVEFITTFIDGLQYVITYIKWFEGLGIVFSLFIFILMIRLLIMLIKGSNDDRGGNK